MICPFVGHGFAVGIIADEVARANAAENGVVIGRDGHLRLRNHLAAGGARARLAHDHRLGGHIENSSAILEPLAGTDAADDALRRDGCAHGHSDDEEHDTPTDCERPHFILSNDRAGERGRRAAGAAPFGGRFLIATQHHNRGAELSSCTGKPH